MKTHRLILLFSYTGIIAFLLFFSVNSLAQQSNHSIPYFKSNGIVSSKSVESNKLFTLFDLEISVIDPRTEENLVVKAHYFQKLEVTSAPLLILVPPIKGISIREKRVSKYFLKKGFNVIVIEPIRDISNSEVPIVEFENKLLSFVGAVRSVIDVMEEKPEIQKENIFLWASSMGAIYSSIVIGVEDRINASVLILGAGSIPDIVTESEQKYIVNYRNSRIEQEGLSSVEDFRLKLKKNMRIDPLLYTSKGGKPNVFFVLAKKDNSVPTKYQQALFEAYGSPSSARMYNTNHAGALMKSHLFKLDEIYSFIQLNRKAVSGYSH